MVHLAPNKKQIESGELRKRRLVIRAGLYNTPKTRARLLYYSVSPVYAAGGDRPKCGSGRTRHARGGADRRGREATICVYAWCQGPHMQVHTCARVENRNQRQQKITSQLFLISKKVMLV